MIANLFEKTTHKAYISSAIFSLIAVFFVQYCKNYGAFSIEVIARGILFWGIFVFFILMITFLESRFAYNNYAAIHLFSFPMAFLFFPHGPGLIVSKIFLGIMLVCSKYIYAKVLFSEKSAKNLFDLSLALSLIVIYNKALSAFYLIPVGVLFKQRYRDIKHMMSFLLPIIFVPLFFAGIYRVTPIGFFDSFYSVLKVNLWNFKSQSNSETFWFIILALSVFVALFYKPRSYEKISNPEKFSGFFFMSFWLYTSIFVGFMGFNVGQGRWFLSFIPAAYFIGVFLRRIGPGLVQNILILCSFFAVVIFKLIEFKILSL